MAVAVEHAQAVGILVHVDDNPAVELIYGRRFRERGFDYRRFGMARSALRWLDGEEEEAVCFVIDCLLLLDGARSQDYPEAAMALIRRIRSEAPKMPIVALTNYLDEMDQALRREGFDDVVSRSKSPDPDSLIQCVSELVAGYLLARRIFSSPYNAGLPISHTIDTDVAMDPEGREWLRALDMLDIRATATMAKNPGRVLVQFQHRLRDQAYLLSYLTTTPMILRASLPATSLEELAAYATALRIRVDITDIVEGNRLDDVRRYADHVGFVGMYPSGVVRTVAATLAIQGHRALLTLRSGLYLLDPDAEGDPIENGSIQCHLAIVGLLEPRV